MPYSDFEKQRLSQRKYYEDNKDIYRNSVRKRRAAKRDWFKNIISKLFCIVCLESTNECLDFHYIDPKKKDRSVSVLVGSMRTKEMIINEMNKCVILCSNCHRKYHAGNLNREFTNDDCIKFLTSHF